MRELWPKLEQLIADGPYGSLLLLLEYGSRAVDSDFLAVYRRKPATSVVVLGRLDLWAIGHEDFAAAAKRWDPFITEPLLSGNALIETIDLRLSAGRQLLTTPVPLSERVAYLVGRGHESLNRAKSMQADGSWDDAVARLFWCNVSYAFSYYHFANLYSRLRPEQPLRLTELIGGLPHNDQELWQTILRQKVACASPDHAILDSLAGHLAGGASMKGATGVSE